MKPAILVLVIACLGLTAGLLVIRQTAEDRIQTARAERARAAAELEDVKTKFTDLEKLYAVQQGTLNMRDEELAVASNAVARANVEVAKLTQDIKTLQVEMLKRQERIAALESERDDLTKKMEDLTASIGTLETQIADTRKKLASSEGDKTFLAAELKRLQAEKDTLVRQFNSLAALRVQVAKLKEEAAIKQRLEWKRLGVYAMQEKKGAERLFARTFVPKQPESRLDAEIFQVSPHLLRAPASTNGASREVIPVESPGRTP
jgi:chromosome segregation ATPase